MTDQLTVPSNINLDDGVDQEIAECLNLDCPRSFFLFAGAGSGKTSSLVKALKHVRSQYGQRLALYGQSVAVITYTNAACDEICRRVEFSPLFSVKTIHAFAWEMIQGFTSDIREWLRSDLSAEIVRIEEQEKSGRAGTQASRDRLAQIESKRRRLERLKDIKSFAYSPTGDNREPNSLNHSEVIELCAAFLSTKPLMQSILIRKYPFLLIDESQDTNKRLMDAFFAVDAAHSGQFALGLIGDTMQRIYTDGKDKLGENLPSQWASPSKKLNHRCPRRVVRLINKIRSSVDDHLQVPRSDADEGCVRLFVRPADDADRWVIENSVRERMASISGDEAWKKLDECQVLTLEHHMAAKRMGFEKVLEPLHRIDRFRTGLLDGSLPVVRFFTQNVLPLANAVIRKDDFMVARVVRMRSPLLDVQALKDEVKPGDALRSARDAVTGFMELWDGASPTLGQILQHVSGSGLFALPERLKSLPAVLSAGVEAQSDDEDPSSSETTALLDFLNAPYEQIVAYDKYVSGMASFGTHQGVKGLEFDRVMAILDDTESRGFLFGYEKFLGAAELSKADKKNVEEGKETGVDRTRRLFYVICSRAEKSLALVVYSKNPAAVRSYVLSNGWFEDDEIDGGECI